LFASHGLALKALIDSYGFMFRYLKYIYNTSLIKSQDVFTVLRYISYNTYGKTMTWDWIRLNWQYLVDRYANELTGNVRSMSICISCYMPSLSIVSLYSYNHWPLHNEN